jgi:hypothetical protein
MFFPLSLGIGGMRDLLSIANFYIFKMHVWYLGM